MIKYNKETIIQGIIKSSFLNLLARIFGYLKQVSIAVLIGFNINTDAFFLALGILGLFLIFTEVFDSLGVPNLVKARLKSTQYFYKFAGALLTFTIIFAVTITLLAYCLSFFIEKIALGFNAYEANILREYFLLLLPYLFLSFFFHHFGAIHRSCRHFTPYFVGEFLFAFFGFLFTTLGLLFLKNPKVLPISLDLAQLIATIYIILISKTYWKVSFFVDKTIKNMFRQFFQLLMVYAIFHIYSLIDKIFASFLPPKSISALSYGWMIAMIPRGIFKLENIIITSLAESNANKELVFFYLKKIFLVFTFVAMLIFLFAPVLVKFLFGYGAFSNIDIQLTVDAVRFYSLGLPFIFLWVIFYRIFQILDKIQYIIPIVLVSIASNGILNYLFIFKAHLGIVGISIATSFSYILLSIFSYRLFVNLNK